MHKYGEHENMKHNYTGLVISYTVQAYSHMLQRLCISNSSQYGNRAFSVGGLVAWNSLQLHIHSAPTLLTFKNMLKTHLFSHSYFTNCFAEYEQRTFYSALVVTSHVTAPYKLFYYYYYYNYYY